MFLNSSITETGLPKSENGSFVKANEQKLTAMEQKAYSLYLDAHMVRIERNHINSLKSFEIFVIRACFTIFL